MKNRNKKFNKKNKSSKTNKILGKAKKGKSEYEGIYRVASKNFGFVKLMNLDEEVFVASRDSMNAMDDDKVLIKIIENENNDKKNDGKHREGKILKIIERNRDYIIGIFEPNKGFGFVRPINKKIPFDIHIDKKYFSHAVKDSMVEVKLLTDRKSSDNPEGMIVSVIGHKDDANAEITALVKDFGIVDTFSDEALREADNVAIPIIDSDIKFNGFERVDLRDKFFITIDGEDTKDIDDAICLEKIDGNNLVLYVSIADVTHYVKENSKLDREALLRGNSVYLLDRVIPMLPHVLSNGMCSLNPNEDRLSLTCEMLFSKNGDVKLHKVYESIIRSKRRMTYTEVQALYDAATPASTKLMDNDKDNSELIDMLMNMLDLSRKIRHLREKRGAVNFDLKETVIEVDKDLKPIRISEKVRIEAYKLIEDFMVSANESVASEFFSREVPFLYRTHEEPDKEKMIALSNTLNSLGVPFHLKETILPKDIQNLMKEVEGKPCQYAVERLTLRSMAQARYTKKSIGHFALASKYYTHFTSPIRRYNDLQIHRIIKEVLENRFSDKRKEYFDNILDDVAMRISKTERLAVDCERDIEDLKKCEYMEKFVGEEYEGVISGLTNFGIFVELPNTIEGMVPLRDITDDYYDLDEEKYQIVGNRTKKVFRFGDKVKVKLVKVSKELRTIDFVFV